MKLKPIDMLALLRAFGVATDEDVSTDISRVNIHTPSAHNKAFSFVFRGTTYAILVDDSVEDSAEHIATEFAKVLDAPDISPLENPLESDTTYGMPYHGKACFLAKLTNAKVRLDKALFALHGKTFSRSSLQAFIKQGRVGVDEQIITTPSKLIDARATLTLDAPSQEVDSSFSLPIIYEDDDVLVIDKPAGVMTHPKNERDTEPSVASFIAPRLTEPHGESGREGIVHRLDRDTSGVLICTKHAEAHAMLKAQFADRTTKKTYVAVLEKAPNTPEAIIDAPIARSAKNQSVFRVDARGKQATTEYHTIHVGAKPLVILTPKTGRTHQLRVHMAYIGTPILGDRLYGNTSADRLYLHASELTCTLPNGETHTFTSPVPSEFKKVSHG